MDNFRNRLKNAELLSLLGAVVAGAGAALLLRDWLDAFKLSMLVGGLLIHATAMFYRQRLENASGGTKTRWGSFLYWSCWLLLALFGIYVVAVGASGFAA